MRALAAVLTTPGITTEDVFAKLHCEHTRYSIFAAVSSWL